MAGPRRSWPSSPPRAPSSSTLGRTSGSRTQASWARWYGTPHPAPELLGTAVYGLVERAETALTGARLIAVPGCYPTAAILASAPLLDAGLAERHLVVVDALSGASGAGSGLDRGPALRGARRRRDCLRPRRPPPHRRDGAGARCHGAVHAPPRADRSGPARDVLPARGTGRRREAAPRRPARRLRRGALRRRHRRPAAPEVGAGDQRGPRHRCGWTRAPAGWWPSARSTTSARAPPARRSSAPNVALGHDETAGLALAGVWP